MMDDETLNLFESLMKAGTVARAASIVVDRLGSMARAARGKWRITRDGAGFPILFTSRGTRDARPGCSPCIILSIDSWGHPPYHDDYNIKNRKISKESITRNYMIATTLQHVQEALESGEHAGFSLLFHAWDVGAMQFLDLAGRVINDQTWVWVMEPTGFFACPVEKSFVELSTGPITIPPSDRESILHELNTIVNDVGEQYKPRHELYDLSGRSPYSPRFLVGAPTVKPSIIEMESTVEIRFDLSGMPLDTALATEIMGMVNEKLAHLEGLPRASVAVESLSRGAKFPASTKIMNILEEVYRDIRRENLYVDWYTRKSVASILFQQHEGLPAVIFGPDHPDFKKDWQVSLSSATFTDFEAIMDGILQAFNREER
ncbi:MAG: hypothetical protein ACTSUE_08460 [Promethearchaeota archaeon]